MNTFDFNPRESATLTAKLDSLVGLANSLYSQKTVTQEIALEADRICLDSNLLSAYHSSSSSEHKFKLALEEINGGIVALIALGIVAVITLLTKLIDWIKGKLGYSKSKSYSVHTEFTIKMERATASRSGTVSSVTQEVQKAIDDGLPGGAELGRILSLKDPTAKMFYTNSVYNRAMNDMIGFAPAAIDYIKALNKRLDDAGSDVELLKRGDFAGGTKTGMLESSLLLSAGDFSAFLNSGTFKIPGSKTLPVFKVATAARTQFQLLKEAADETPWSGKSISFVEFAKALEKNVDDKLGENWPADNKKLLDILQHTKSGMEKIQRALKSQHGDEGLTSLEIQAYKNLDTLSKFVGQEVSAIGWMGALYEKHLKNTMDLGNHFSESLKKVVKSCIDKLKSSNGDQSVIASLTDLQNSLNRT